MLPLCRPNLRKALYRGRRPGVKAAKIDATLARLHEDRNHMLDVKHRHYLATKWIVKKNLPLDHLESPEAIELIADLDPKEKKGISRYVIDKNLT